MKRLGTLSAAIALLLPLFLLATDTSTGARDIEVMARLHQSPAFPWRVLLTALYFPAVIAAHVALVYVIPKQRRMMAGLFVVFFVIGNAIDAVYRAVQFAVVHYTWSSAWLEADATARRVLESKITGFGEVGVGVYIAFSLFFAVGRLGLGAITVSEQDRWLRALGVTFWVVGLLNILPWIGRMSGVDFLTGLGAYYLLPWFTNLTLLGVVLHRAHGRTDRA